MNNKRFDELQLSNAFLFSSALSQPEICRNILEIILGRAVTKVSVHTEHNLIFTSDFKSVRLDVYAEDIFDVSYNLEMQNENEHNLALRSRFYQAEIDMASLKPGESYENLKPVMVIFICTFDPFGRGLYRYTYDAKCTEDGVALDDGAQRIFLNTKGRNAEHVPELLVEFLKYVESDIVAKSDVNLENASTKAPHEKIVLLHDQISALKASRKWRNRFMTMEEYLKKRDDDTLQKGINLGITQGIAQGISQGIAQGEERLAALYQKMKAHGEEALFANAAIDPSFRNQMFAKYHI